MSEEKKSSKPNWQALAEELFGDMEEWRKHHPKATFREIEEAVSQRVERLRAQMLEDSALKSDQTDWSKADPNQIPRCEQCGTPLQARGKHQRQVLIPGGEEVTLERNYGVCPKCGVGLFPPG